MHDESRYFIVFVTSFRLKILERNDDFLKYFFLFRPLRLVERIRMPQYPTVQCIIRKSNLMMPRVPTLQYHTHYSSSAAICTHGPVTQTACNF